ncbi:MAG: HAMP domain-containing protein [Phycisphaerales bacterium]|nr:MAG: HAMP domain-containing protein [Phycisphaerales bacterium]
MLSYLLPRRWLRISLARKISLLFGAAVLLIIAVTLAFPWSQMTALNEQAMLVQAKQVALAAYQAIDLHEPDWNAAQRQLDQSWPMLVREIGLPPQQPRLVPDGLTVGPGFQRDAIKRLRGYPDQRYYWRIQNDGRLFRFAMAIRGTQTDPHPSMLRGIIDVRLPTPQAAGVWNSVVTVLAGASGAVLAILVFYLVAQRLVLSPVLRLRRVAEKVTTGDISVRSSIHSGDEFEELSDALNDMLTHIKAAQEEQQKINRSLDIRLGELAETNVALYESNRVKGEFLANVTHELRTPLVSIIGFAELLRDAWGSPDADRRRLARYSQNILASGRNLLDIINDLLDLAKIEAGKMELHLSEFSIAELCQDLIDFVRPLADKRNQSLSLELAKDLPRCRSDSGKIKQILYNLLSNAVKFTPTGGTVSLAVEGNEDAFVRLSVRDTGPGIPEDQRDVIFDVFRQLDASQTREHEGTGLGLAITRELVQLLGGEIQFESQTGKGTTFVVELPIQVSDMVEGPPIGLT